jgi:phage terminase large subunit-like protein
VPKPKPKKKTPSRRTGRPPKPPIPAKWLKLFTLIPGYDPVKTAGRCWFDAKQAEKCVRFCAEKLTHIEGELAGKPLTLEPWQQAVIGAAFGWKRPDGTRRYREVFEYVPRKNGKSTKLGALVNMVALLDGEPGAQIYSAAADREQASLVYRQAKGMLLQSPQLAGLVRVYTSVKSIEYPNGVVYKALSSDADNKHGFNTHFVVVDELHAHYSRDLVDVLVTSTGSRRQPLVWYITTADYERESICNEKYEYACRVRDSKIDDEAFLPVIYEATPEDDWTSEATWRKANPNLGVSVSLEYLKRECKRAQEVPSYENTFKRLHLNVRTRSDVRWLSLDQWDRCKADFTVASLAGRRCVAALDLSSKIDVTCLMLWFPPDDPNGEHYIHEQFFVPKDTAERRERQDRVPYTAWIRDGWMTATPGNVVDQAAVEQAVRDAAKLYRLGDVAFDPWGAQYLATRLQDEGARMVEFRQGYASMSEPSKELEKLIVAGKIRHRGNPCMRWMAGNAAAEIDPAGNIKPSKAKSTERIDGVVAAVMALGRAMVNTKEPEEIDIRVINY